MISICSWSIVIVVCLILVAILQEGIFQGTWGYESIIVGAIVTVDYLMTFPESNRHIVSY